MTTDDDLDQSLETLTAHLDASHIRLPAFGCFVALSPDRTAIFYCPMNRDGTPWQYSDDGHMDWTEVTAPEAEFVEKVNELYGTAFRYEQFAGR